MFDKTRASFPVNPKIAASLACPDCRGGLVVDEGDLCCLNCDRAWNTGAGILDFATKEHYWNQIPKEGMKRLLTIARDESYEDALREVLLPLTNEYTFRYATDESRADFKVLLPVVGDCSILDVGCGWGAVAISLARSCGRLVAADTTLETLEFLKIRTEQEGVDNITLIRIDPLDFANLPFLDASFDVVIMNGVLEWVGDARQDISPRSVQLACLGEMRRLIAPGGYLYIGIENRYGYRYFGGFRDHSGIPFTSLLPRWLASMVMRTLRRKDYRTYTYTCGGYKALLREAGFSNVFFYHPIPTYRSPDYLVPLEQRNVIKYYVNNLMSVSDSPSFKRKMLKRVVKFVLPLIPFRHLAFSYSIVAKVAV